MRSTVGPLMVRWVGFSVLLAGAWLSVAAMHHASFGQAFTLPSSPELAAIRVGRSAHIASESRQGSPQRVPNPLSSDPRTMQASAGQAGNLSGARTPAGAELPSAVLLNVPFSPQAPFGDWSQPWADTCEETSVLMAMAWVRGESLSPEGVYREILNLVDWELYHFGYHRDTALRETAKLFTHSFGYRPVRLAYDITFQDIKQELAAGNVVIVPASGKVLARENPYYASPPPYHMVVVVGYDDRRSEVIVNDPGTKRGRAFRYSYEIFPQAIHDWTGDEATVNGGRTGMIVVSRLPEP